jgi:hypothetical protein
VTFFIVACAIAIGAVIAGVVVFLMFGLAWAAWGFWGAIVILGAIGIAAAYAGGRRSAHRRRVAA